MSRWEAIWSDGTRIVWRSLSWKEFKQFNSRATHPAERYLEIYKTCILEGPPPNKVGFGIVRWLGIREFDESPFTGHLPRVTAAVNISRDQLAKDYFAACSAVIASVLHMSFDEIEKLDADGFFTRVAQAEFIVGKPLDPVDPRTRKASGRRPRKPWEQGAKDTQFERSDFTFTK